MTPYPPFFRGPATCRGSTDYQSKGGAERLATIIREAWRKCGVIVSVKIETKKIQDPEDENQRKPMHLVRVELVGGLPGRVG